MPPPTVVQLELFITDAFNLSELEDLCAQLDVEYENLHGDTLNGKSLELVKYMNRRGRLPDLAAALARERPDKYQSAFGGPTGSIAMETAPPPPGSGAQSHGAWRGIPLWGRVVGLLLALALALWAGLTLRGVNGVEDSIESTPQATAGAVETAGPVAEPNRSLLGITQPVEDDEVRRALAIRGEMTGELCETCRIYVFVHPLHSRPSTYYYQTDTEIELAGRSFIVNGIILGDETAAGNGEQFEIWVALAADTPPAPRMTGDEWLAFPKQAADHVTVTRVDR